jgi:hypothetical protein
MLITVATVLAGLIGVAVIVMGAFGLWAPRAAVGFGIPGARGAQHAGMAGCQVRARHRQRALDRRRAGR